MLKESLNKKIEFSKRMTLFFVICLVISSWGLAIQSPASAQTAAQDQGNSAETTNEDQAKPKSVKPIGPADEYNRGVPRSSLKGYLKAARDGDFERAAIYLDLRYLPYWVSDMKGAQLARQLKIALDKELWFDLEVVSAHPDGDEDDGLPANRDIIGRIKTPEKTVDILLQWVPRGDGVDIWKFSNQTVNLQIAREFNKEGIKFAFPTSTTYLAQEDNQPLFLRNT